jgi:hypothetical protein
VQYVIIFTCLNVVVCLEHEVQVFVCGCEVSLYCVCIYRCIHLERLAVSRCLNVTDAGVSIVISHCIRLRTLNLNGLKQITGMYALCEDANLTLHFITLWCMISLQEVHNRPQRPTTGPYCEPV